MNVLHGSANVIGGQNAVIKLCWEKDAADLFCEGTQPEVKFALGESPKQTIRDEPDSDLLYVPARLRHVLIRRQRVALSSRHTRFYERFTARPKPTSRGNPCQALSLEFI